MAKAKIEFLKEEGLLNPKPERVIYPPFEAVDFFDRLDLAQVRYEMLRLAKVENTPVSKACELFGFSREYFYRLLREFMARGYATLLGTPKGRRPLIALNQEIINFITHRKISDPDLTGQDLRKEILELYKVDCSPRTVQRAVEKLGLGKKGLHTS